MGQEIATSHFTTADFDAFTERLRLETALLEEWFQAGRFCAHQKMAGFELEAWLIDRDFRPAPINAEFLERLASPLVVPELARFNVELNGTPLPLTGHVLSEMGAELAETWSLCAQTAHNLNAELVMVGMLPTVRQEDLTLANVSALARFRALNEQVFRLRQDRPLHLKIHGQELLDIQHPDIMIEAAATSFQTHLQVSPAEAVRYYNASQILSAPIVAVAANSPYLFGKDLWDETRIPLFEQAVAGGDPDLALRRVSFGTGYARGSLMECFQENLTVYPVLLPMAMEGAAEHLRHVRLHNGTIWRWNRPLIGFGLEGEPHVRIEHRVIPAGPTLVDSLANAALYYGLVQSLATQAEPPEARLPFETAQDNFYQAAQHGLRAQITWVEGQQVSIRALFLEHLLPLAHRGLEELGLVQGDIALFLGIIAGRVQTGQNGAAWQRAYVAHHGATMTELTAAYVAHQHCGEPVHEWNL
ncbi:hypothetical protein [Anthocerotibacter panamensis]|uniref:hypothetical protein n=1 Tax=Anthocerotibacter panamensis TaxID=2857077 RepID=UPI001C407BD6|nr:hypothetical protein [Anthocerotibacter panamensis]